jgi:hypothetical protein
VVWLDLLLRSRSLSLSLGLMRLALLAVVLPSMFLVDMFLMDFGFLCLAFPEIRQRLSLGGILGRKDLEHISLNDMRRSFLGLIRYELDSGLRHRVGYGVDEHGTTPPGT